MTKSKRSVPGYIFGSAKAAQVVHERAGRSRIKKLPSAEELLGNAVAADEPGPVETDMRGTLVDIISICQRPGRSADKIKLIEARALAGLAE